MEDLHKVKEDLASLRHFFEVRMIQKLWDDYAVTIEYRIAVLEDRVNNPPAVTLSNQVTQPDVASHKSRQARQQSLFLRL